jgi:hypothetical protein
MKTLKVKTVKGYTALTRILAELGVSDHAMDIDCLAEVLPPLGYPRTPFTYGGGTVAYWKGFDGYYAWPEVSQLKYEIHKLITD